MDTVFDKTPAIIVDYPTWRTHQPVVDFLKLSKDAHLVLFVPANIEYEWEEGDPDFQAVIRNNGKMDNLAFKTAALCLVQDSGTLVPAVAIDNHLESRQMYMAANVPVVLDGNLHVELERGEYFDVA